VDLAADLRAQDRALHRAGLEIWIGAEPTFTDRSSQEPPWLWQAEGGDKEARARALLLALAPRLGAARLRRTQGRLFPGEERPRFCLGALFHRGAAGEPETSLLDDPPGPAPMPGPGESWLTVTPDPGVVEVNLAPAPDLCTFAADVAQVYAAAAEAGLSAERFRFNGHATDSGGGGQVTLGGPAPERSPFFLRPRLLPRLVRYLWRHPSLSYAFAPDCAGSAGQGPRPDEGVRELYQELPVALDWLVSRGDELTPGELWGALAPLLVDPSGNAHRAELNLEKLWNPHLPGRGRLGVVEFRALRMPATPARLAAVAALFRAVAARLAAAPFQEPPEDWGHALHDRLALPHHLAEDLREVLEDLDGAGFGLGPALRAELTRPPEAAAVLELPGARLTLTPALDFWPLIGDVASQERHAARLVDSSSARLELRVEADGSPGVLSWRGWEIPLRSLGAGRHLAAVRYRAFLPRPGLHPGLGPLEPLELHWAVGDAALAVALHGWRPDGGGYSGLPADAGEAATRRRERARITPALPVPTHLPRSTGLTLDLRRLAAAA